MASLTDLEVVSGPGVSSSGSPVSDRAGLRSAATAIIGSPSNGQAKGIGRHWLAYSQPHGGCVTGRAHRMKGCRGGPPFLGLLRSPVPSITSGFVGADGLAQAQAGRQTSAALIPSGLVAHVIAFAGI